MKCDLGTNSWEQTAYAGDELADLGAGTSPVRGIAVVGAALVVGITIAIAGFDGRGRNEVDVRAVGVSQVEPAETESTSLNVDSKEEEAAVAASPEVEETGIGLSTRMHPRGQRPL